jgi:hypothetical protein
VVFTGIHARSISTASSERLCSRSSGAWFGSVAGLYQPCYRLFDRAKSAYSRWPAV